jgi:phosphate transport system protein
MLARQTLADDARVNRDEVEVDEMCLLLLAKRQPMASDLRFISVALKLVTDIERIADLAANIAERVLDLNAAPPLRETNDVQQLSRLAVSMYRDAIDAFARADVAQAQAVISRDDEVDEMYHHIFREILADMLADSDAVERGIHLQSVIKYIERIADHATNVAEQVVFMAQGMDVRHRGSFAPTGGQEL